MWTATVSWKADDTTCRIMVFFRWLSIAASGHISCICFNFWLLPFPWQAYVSYNEIMCKLISQLNSTGMFCGVENENRIQNHFQNEYNQRPFKSPSCRKRIRRIRSRTQLDSINFLDSLFHSPLSSKWYFPRIEGSWKCQPSILCDYCRYPRYYH